jgi:hypothetical protein
MPTAHAAAFAAKTQARGRLGEVRSQAESKTGRVGFRYQYRIGSESEENKGVSVPGQQLEPSIE